jgi:opacity protein-like surface antigen
MRRGVLTLVCILAALTLSATAQDEAPRLEIGLQGNGFFTKSSENRDVRQSVSENGGFMLNVRYGLNRWLSTDVTYGWNRVTNRYSTDQFSTIQSNVHQITAGFVVKVPVSKKVTPYLLAEGGALIFDPTGASTVPFAARQGQGTFVYGGGVDYALFRWLALRGEYRGLVYNAPDFDIRGLSANAVTHTAQPSAGIVIRF